LFYVDFNARKAFDELNRVCGYKAYGNKHCESTLTKFLQEYYLPLKFKIDKRKSHYSSMIVSGQMTRGEALQKLSEPLYNENLIWKDIDFVINEIGITRDEFNKIMAEPPRQHSEYSTSYVNKITSKILELRKKSLGY
jgi:hypothetical protein